MITLLKSYIANPTGKDNIVRSRAVMKLAGLSTDEKPLIKFKDIEIENGSSFVEIDTSKIYKYDEENNEWIEQVKGSNKDIIIENNALLTYINEVTGGNDDNLSDAVATLADGYGSDKISIDDLVYAPNIKGEIILSSATTISPYILFDHDDITSIKGDFITTIYQQAFNACSGLQTVDFPNLSSLIAPGGQFNGCSNLEYIHIPKVTAIPANCFTNCVKLYTISLPNCSSISNNSFLNCKALTDIYLPNAESTYIGAPWGATNAIIHYNTQFNENGEPIIE